MDREKLLKSLLEMNRGGFLEQVDYEMAKVVDNVLDPNTKATGKRKIAITIEIIPDDTRLNLSVNFTTKLALVPTNPLTTNLYIAGKNSAGEIQVVEMVPQIPGQFDMDGNEQSAPPVLKIIKIS